MWATVEAERSITLTSDSEGHEANSSSTTADSLSVSEGVIQPVKDNENVYEGDQFDTDWDGDQFDQDVFKACEDAEKLIHSESISN